MNGASFGLGFLAGFGTGYFSREIAGAGGVMFKPAIKAVIKTAVIGVTRLKESLANIGETFEDLVAEAKAEMSANHMAGTAMESEGGGVHPEPAVPVAKRKEAKG